MRSKLGFQQAVYKYACHLQDFYGQSLGGSVYPDESCSYQDNKGIWHLRGMAKNKKSIRLAMVKPNGFVIIT